MVKILSSSGGGVGQDSTLQCRGCVGSITGQRAMIPHAGQCAPPQKKNPKQLGFIFPFHFRKAQSYKNCLSHNCFGSIFFVFSSFVLPNILFPPSNLLKVSSCRH